MKYLALYVDIYPQPCLLLSKSDTCLDTESWFWSLPSKNNFGKELNLENNIENNFELSYFHLTATTFFPTS